jgi:hypothetical protein
VSDEGEPEKPTNLQEKFGSSPHLDSPGSLRYKPCHACLATPNEEKLPNKQTYVYSSKLSSELNRRRLPDYQIRSRMLNPPMCNQGAATKNEATGASILTLQAPTTQQFPRTQQMPPLPLHIDHLLDSDWTQEASLKLDRWLHYVSLEFEVAGGVR